MYSSKRKQRTETSQITNNWLTDLIGTYNNESAKTIMCRSILYCLSIKIFDHAYTRKPEGQ